MEKNTHIELIGYYSYVCKITPGHKYYELLGGHDDIPVYCSSRRNAPNHSLYVLIGDEEKVIKIVGTRTPKTREVKDAAKDVRDWIEGEVYKIRNYIPR